MSLRLIQPVSLLLVLLAQGPVHALPHEALCAAVNGLVLPAIPAPPVASSHTPPKLPLPPHS